MADLVVETAKEILDTLDPPPGLRLWLDQNGLGLLPLRLLDETVGREPIEAEPFHLRLPTDTTATITSALFAIGDRVSYKTLGNPQRMGIGIITCIEHPWVEVMTDSQVVVGVLITAGDELKKL